jgi:hypothetical protein
MKNPNSPLNRMKASLKERWLAPDFPGGEPRLQLLPIAKDVGLFILFPTVCVLLANAGGHGSRVRKGASIKRAAKTGENQDLQPQILSFEGKRVGASSAATHRRAPGTLVRVRLMNVAETLIETPIHAQILDYSLGREYYGGTLLGDGAGESNFSRMNILFRFAKRRGDESNAYPISARALSLDGTLGLDASKKEGMFARGVLGGAASTSGVLGKAGGAGQSLQAVLLQALTQGLSQEFAGEAATARNNASVLTLEPGREFFAELKDFFPSGGR